MTCVCLAQFCYLCGAEYDSDHFETTPCRQFSVSTLSRITLAQVGKEAFENWLRTNDGRLTDSEKKQLRNYEVDPDNLSLRQKKGIMEVIEPHLRLAVCVASAAVVSAMLHYSTSRF
jgi:hypothetical protein